MIKHLYKYLILALFLLSTTNIRAQILSFDYGKVQFYTSSIMSDIDAISEDVKVKLDVQTGDVEIKIVIETFEFEYELMQEHFNEEYLESDKFPEATFNGKVAQDISNLSGDTEVDVSGELNIHGVKKEIEFKATFSKKEGYTVVKCKFAVIFKHFNVEEPSILSKSLAKDVEVKSTLYLK